MRLLDELLNQFIASNPTRGLALRDASTRLSKRYKGAQYSEQLKDDERLAYVFARMPATNAAVTDVLNILSDILAESERHYDSLLDVGAGPGSASIAAFEHFPTLKKFTLLERDQSFIDLSRRLFSSHPQLSKANIQSFDIQKDRISQSASLVLASYVAQELATDALPAFARGLWSACENTLVILEPGTPKGFENILTLREELLALGAHLVAPCPQSLPCPIEKPDWCHFSVRFERREEHQIIKKGTLGYEDEKYSYLVFSTNKVEAPKARVIRMPIKRSGHIVLDLCTGPQIERRVVSRSQKEAMKTARRLKWGSSLDTLE